MSEGSEAKEPSTGMIIGAVAVAALLVAGGLMAFLFLTPEEDDNGDGTALSLVGADGSVVNLTWDELDGETLISGHSQSQNRFGNWGAHGTYEGVALSDLVDKVGGMEPGDTLVVTATDGYSHNLTYLNVYPSAEWEASQGQFIVALSFNSSSGAAWEDGPKLVCLPADGKFSNDDCNRTSAAGQGYFLNPSAGSRWVRNLARIEVVDGPDDWSITLKGETERVLWGTEYEMLFAWKGVSGISIGYKVSYPNLDLTAPKAYEGVRLADLVSLVWNVSNAYSVELVAADGVNLTLSHHQAEGRVAVYGLDKSYLGIGDVDAVLARRCDGAAGFSGGQPLRLAFVNTTGAVTDYALSLKDVVSLRLTEYLPDWSLEVVLNYTGMATKSVTLTRSQFEHGVPFHTATVTRSGKVYEGMALWMLVCMVDGNDTLAHYEFNDSFAAAGYHVKVSDSLGYTAMLTSEQVARNDTLVVANRVDGDRFADDDSNWPLRLVGATLVGTKNVKNVVRIEIVA